MKYLAFFTLLLLPFVSQAKWVENKVGATSYAVETAYDGEYSLDLHISTTDLAMFFVERTTHCSVNSFKTNIVINGLSTEVSVYCYNNWHIAEVVDPDSLKILFELLDNQLHVIVGDSVVTFEPTNLAEILFEGI